MNINKREQAVNFIANKHNLEIKEIEELKDREGVVIPGINYAGHLKDDMESMRVFDELMDVDMDLADEVCSKLDDVRFEKSRVFGKRYREEKGGKLVPVVCGESSNYKVYIYDGMDGMDYFMLIEPVDSGFERVIESGWVSYEGGGISLIE